MLLHENYYLCFAILGNVRAHSDDFFKKKCVTILCFSVFIPILQPEFGKSKI